MTKAIRALSWIVPLAIMATIGILLAIILAELDAADTERDQQHAEIVALQAGLDEANARLEAEGEAPVPVPDVEPGAEPPVVSIAPTQDQILSAFDVWCELRSCHGSDGADGKDASPMTRQQIFAGFTEWCSTDPRCIGRPGSDGADSTVPGPQGRPPTPEEILAAVEVVCANDACDGKDGTDGKDGADGKDGRGFVGVECLSTGDWIFTLDDGTALTATGPCRAVQPTPTPTPTATTTKGR